VQRIIRCIEIEDDLLGRPRVRLHEQVDQQGLDRRLNPRSRPMEKIENNQVERVLRDDELVTVNGGFGFVERFTNPLLIYGFNPQPDPPGAPLGR
jgi:hypothetical protein